jgi:perosamine synthetase
VIPVFEPEIGPAEIDAVVAALRRGEISGSFGESIPSFEREFARYCGCEFGVAVSSGTAALHLAVRAAGVGPGDEVLVSASTNIATALAVLHNGAIPVPVDSEEESWNLDLDLIESLITPRTKAVLPVHLFGHPVDMERLVEIADRHGLVVIEDAAEAHGATCRGRKVGSFGAMGCFSFYANKLITTGEGGMVVTDSEELAERLRLLRNLAFAEPRFRHEEAGYNYRMTGYQAAMGLAQLPRLEHFIRRKREVAATYSALLGDLRGLRLPREQSWARSVFWMYGIVVDEEAGITRDELATALRADGIDSRTFFCPMNLQPCLTRSPGFREVPCPVAESLWERGLYLPSSTGLDEATIAYVAGRVTDAIRG